MSGLQVNCVLIGHDYSHEVQVIAQVFFENPRFVFCKEIPAEGVAVAGCLQDEICIGELYQDGKKISSCTLKVQEEGLKRTLMLVIFYALKEATGKPTPWGALTGVRPAKQVRLWLDEGLSETKIHSRLSKIYKLRDDKIELALTVAKAEQRLISKIKLNSLYIAVPFCPSRCLYCSFVAAQKAKPDAHKRYLAALAEECKTLAENSDSLKNVRTIYVGGGTPTTFSANELERLLEIAAPFSRGSAKQKRIENDVPTEHPAEQPVEYTVEAGRPDSITADKLQILKNFGVNRIAINPQTLNNDTLNRIGRAHTAADFYKAYEMAQRAGFTNINVDVIAGLPGETPEDMRRTMENIKKLAPAHITVHTLAVKRASRLIEHREDYKEAKFEHIDDMLDIAREICENLGQKPYYMYRQKNMAGLFENVGYSLYGYECLYNVAMMAEVQTVIGVGAGAVTKIVEGDLIKREFNPKDVELYIQRQIKNG